MGSSMGHDSIHDRLDADAVCATCGNVNPEGTLMCKTCGNNLRDQRQRRLSAEVQLEENLKGEGRSYILSGALTAIGLVVVLWAAVNVDRIADRMVGGGSYQAEAKYWTGPEAAAFAPLAAEVNGIGLSGEQALLLASETGGATGFSGTYAVFDGPLADNPRWLGFAAVETGSTQVYFVAQLNAGAELRGTAIIQGNSLSALMDTVTARFAGVYYEVQGVALRQADGGFELYGQSGFSELDHHAYAYPLSVGSPVEAAPAETVPLDEALP